MDELIGDIVERWENLDGGYCPFCGEERRFQFMDESMLSDDFNLETGGTMTEFYSCDRCSGRWYIERRFEPAGDVVFGIDG